MLILGCKEFRTPELDRSLQMRGWDSVWADDGDDCALPDTDLSPAVLVVNSRQGDSSIRSIHSFRDKCPLLPLILVGENARGFTMTVDAYIPYGASNEIWLSTLRPYRPQTMEQQTAQAGDQENFGKYKLIRKIASGGMADIFHAEQVEPEGFNRTLAIKRILAKHKGNPVFIKMLLDEANLGTKLDHQNIARIFDLGFEAGVHYIAMEYVDGRNLRALIDNAIKLGIAFPEPIAALLMIQATEALDYAHRKKDLDGNALNLIHRDVSPQNIMVGAEGAVKLIDFGIAKTLRPKDGQTESKTIQGNLIYMSPEQFTGSPVDHRSDIFSLGLVLFELLASERCYKADDEFELMNSIGEGAVRDIHSVRPGISKPMARILGKALQKNLSNRYSSANKMGKDLKAYLNFVKAESLESDAIAFVKMMQTAQPQAKAFIASRFEPVRGDFALPSEIAEENRPAAGRNAIKPAPGRPSWILLAVDALLVLLAWLLWISINA